MAQFQSLKLTAGAYAVTLNSVSVGIHLGGNQAPALEVIRHAHVVENTDAYGRMAIAAFNQGTSGFYYGTLAEWKTGSLALAYPHTFGTTPTQGSDDYESALSLVLTAQSGSVASTIGPATITASKAYVANDFPITIYLNSELRVIPVKVRLWPYVLTGSTIGHWTYA